MLSPERDRWGCGGTEASVAWQTAVLWHDPARAKRCACRVVRRLKVVEAMMTDEKKKIDTAATSGSAVS